MRPEVADIEIVCLPVVTTQTGFFDDEQITANAVQTTVIRWLREGKVAQRLDKNGRAAFGDRYMRLLWLPEPMPQPANGRAVPTARIVDVVARAIPLDLFVCLPPAQYGVLIALRTGSAAYSNRLVTPRGQTTHRGGSGLLPDGYQVKDGQLWYAGGSLPVPDEATFFEYLGMRVPDPRSRE